MSRSAWIAGLSAVICLAAFFRGHQLTTTPPGLFFDEAANGTDALHAIHTGTWAVFYPQNGGREGLFINLQSLLLRATGIREPWVLRSTSAAFGVLTVLGVALLGKELLGRETALIAAFFMSVGFWHVNFSRIGLRAISAPFFLTWALYLLIVSCRALRQNGPGTRAATLGLAAGLVFGLGFHTYTSYRIAPVVFGLAMVFLLRRSFTQALLVVTGAAAAAFPLFLYFWRHPTAFLQRIFQVAPAGSGPAMAVSIARNAKDTFAMLLTHGDRNWRHNVSGSPELWLPVGLLFALGLILCLTGRPKRDWVPALLLTWLVAGALPAILANEGTPHSLRAILMIPPVYLIAAIGFTGLYRNCPSHWLRPAIAAVFLASVAIQGYTQYFVEWRKDPRVQEAFGVRFLLQSCAIRAALEQHPGSQVYAVVENLGIGDEFYLALPLMFLTDNSDVHYIREGKESQIPPGSVVYHIR
jgi:4-amino-4-deoxy-L-arabinose transferase-like glycosyltransferase